MYAGTTDAGSEADPCDDDQHDDEENDHNGNGNMLDPPRVGERFASVCMLCRLCNSEDRCATLAIEIYVI